MPLIAININSNNNCHTLAGLLMWCIRPTTSRPYCHLIQITSVYLLCLFTCSMWHIIRITNTLEQMNLIDGTQGRYDRPTPTTP